MIKFNYKLAQVISAYECEFEKKKIMYDEYASGHMFIINKVKKEFFFEVNILVLKIKYTLFQK